MSAGVMALCEGGKNEVLWGAFGDLAFGEFAFGELDLDFGVFSPETELRGDDSEVCESRPS